MRFTKLVLPLFTLFAADSFAQEQLDIDPGHSNVNFTVRHLVVAKVSGSFSSFSGAIMYDEKDMTKSSVNVAIKAWFRQL